MTIAATDVNLALENYRRGIDETAYRRGPELSEISNIGAIDLSFEPVVAGVRSRNLPAASPQSPPA